MDTTATQMPTRPIARRHLLQGAAAAGALAGLQLPDLAHVVEADAAAPSLVGAWIVQVDTVGQPKSVDLVTFSKDGLVTDAGSVPLTAPPGQSGPPSVGLGRWAPSAGGGFDVTFVSLAADQKGAFLGTVTISGHLTLGAGGSTVSGPSPSPWRRQGARPSSRARGL